MEKRVAQRKRSESLIARSHDTLEVAKVSERSSHATQGGNESSIDGAVRSALPAKQAPQLGQLAEAPPSGPGWISEIKLDGYRLLVFLNEGKVRVLSRNGLDWTGRLPALAQAVAQLGARTALLDGELVALRPDGISSFADLQDALSEGRDSRLLYCAFDLLYLNGWDLMRPA